MSMDRVFKEIEQAANERFKIMPTDYQKDGLWYCGECNTPKQAIADIAGVIYKPLCRCKCADIKANAEEHRKQLDNVRESCFDDPTDILSTFEVDDASNKIMAAFKRYADGFEKMLRENKGIVIFGDTGVGKTFAANCIANRVIDLGFTARSTSFRTIEAEIRDNNGNKSKVMKGLNSYDLLVIDDWGAERNTEWMYELVELVTDSRCRAKKPLIITTNISADELRNPTDIKIKRVVSRLYEMCAFVEYKGADRRRKKLIKDSGDIKSFLGLDEL